MHRREHVGIIRSSSYHQLAHAECIFHGFCHIVSAKVGDGYLRSTLRTEDFCHLLGYFLGAPMDRSVGDEHPFCFHLVLAPCVVQADVITQVFLQDRAMKRTDAGDVQRSSFLQKCLYLSTILATDVEVVTTRFACPVLFVSQSPELAESVGREEHLVLLVVCHHHFRPMHHRSHEELQGMFAQAQRIAFLHRNGTSVEVRIFEELRHHLDGLGRGNHLHVGVFFQCLGNVSGMVGLHVLHDEVIRCASFEGFFQVCPPVIALAEVNGIHDGHFLIRNQIRIIRNAVRHNVLAFKQIDGGIVHSDVFDSFGNV